MADLTESLTSILTLLGTASFMIVMALVWSYFDLFKDEKTKKPIPQQKWQSALFLGYWQSLAH